MPTLYQKPLLISYRADRVSCASCCTLIYVVACVILPYVAVFALGGLWTKETPAREQPLVRSRSEVYVEAYASASPRGREVVPLLWSTSEPLNDAIGASLRPCEFRTWYEDDELDGYPDRLEYVVTMPVDADAGERVHSVSVIVGLDVRFESEFRLRFNASVHLQAASPLPGRAWRQTADLTLQSDAAQRSLDLPPRPPCPTPTWAFMTPVQPDGAPASVRSILEQYAACNDTVALVAQPPVWTPGVSDTFEARLTVRVPPIIAFRRPGLVETLKLAAVQYIAFFLPIGFLLKCVHSSLFNFGIVAARVHHPVKQHTW